MEVRKFWRKTTGPNIGELDNISGERMLLDQERRINEGVSKSISGIIVEGFEKMKTRDEIKKGVGETLDTLLNTPGFLK